jgi:hypothetical protein
VFLNTMKLISFRAQKMLAEILREQLAQRDDAALVLRNLLNSSADLIPELKRQTLTVRLYPLTPEGQTQALRHLCSELNATETLFPATDLRLFYTVAGPR